MNSYLLRRLLPFFLLTLISEIIFTIYDMTTSGRTLDLSFMAIIKLLGILILTTTSAFLILMIPYVLYLILLPRKYQNSRFDRIITLTGFGIFSVFTFMEEMISSLLGNDYFEKNPFSFQNLGHNLPSPERWLILGTSLIFAGTALFLFRKHLLTDISAPSLPKKIFQGIIYGFICALTYLNISPEDLNVSPNRGNNIFASEGTYDLLKETVNTYQNKKNSTGQ